MLTRFFEEIVPGERTVSRARTITETDLVLFAAFSGDWYPLHTDRVYAAQSRFGQRIAHGMLVLSVLTGLVRIEPELVVAFYGLDRVRFVAPTFIGDTLHAETEVVAVEDRGERGGLVTWKVEGKKETGETVLAAEMKVLVAKRPPVEGR
ncbi:MAG: MaoC family dehydratase N-terminal domain-containing protein [Firmicutes bacterium]|nr:dehydratase [Alicyclobacillaceae bacterium]MCL6497602.1 MaoC family dehydratase N-terminal domain-containing protein [Bacillota bacterium]